MPRFACPHCKSIIKASEEERGMRIDCPECGKPLKVPAGAPQRMRAEPDEDEDDDDEEEAPRPRRRRRRASSGGIPGWVIGLLIFVGVNVLLCCGSGIYFVFKAGKAVDEISKEVAAEMEKERQRKANAVAVTAAQLAKEYRTNEAAADQKYKDQYVKVTGTVEQVGKDADDTPYVILQGGTEAGNVQVQCFFFPNWDEDDDERAWKRMEAQVKKLQKGQQVTIVGQCEGLFGTVRIMNCELPK